MEKATSRHALQNDPGGRDPGAAGSDESMHPDPEKAYYDVFQFLLMPDVDSFLSAAYNCVLKRPPDPWGYDFYRMALDKGRLRQQVLAELLHSGEGRRAGVVLDRLGSFTAWVALREKWPVAARFMTPLVRMLHRVIDRFQQSRAAGHRGRFLWEYQIVRALRDQRIEARAVSERVEKIEQQYDALLGRYQVLKRRIAHISAPTDPEAGSIPSPAAHRPDGLYDDFDDFYLEFEMTFRGSRDAIRDRLAGYLAYLPPLLPDAGRLVADFGCGRGEWLSLVQAAGYDAFGLDTNPVMRQMCINQGLFVSGESILDWMQAQPGGSLAAITAFHLVEHLPFEDVLVMIKEAKRLLQPGGVLILETPNPENIRVSAFAFYHDPTHRNPLTPALLEFTARYAGFCHVEMRRLSDVPDPDHIREEGRAASELDKLLNAPWDLALIAYQPAHGATPEE